MTPNTTGKASPGSPFRPPPAAIWNNMIDAGQAFANSQQNSGAPNPTRSRPTDIIKILNDSAADRRKGEILKIEGKAIEDITDEHIWLKGVEPTDHCYFGILKEPVADHGIGALQVAGCCMALVDVIDTDHTRARVDAESYVLVSDDEGPLEILYHPDDTGEQQCVIRFVTSNRLRVAIIGSLTAPTSSGGTPTTCLVAVLTYSVTENKLIDSERRLTVHNFDESLIGADGTYGKIEFLGGKWEFYWLSCEPSEDFEGLPEDPDEEE
jgi:hypothetical protein